MAGKPKGKWLVGTHGGPGRVRGWEIFVYREGNDLATKSCGWFSDTKLMISSHSQGSWSIKREVFNDLVEYAYRLAARLNNKERGHA